MRIGDAVAHLQVVFQRHLLDGTCIRLALGFERGERTLQVIRVHQVAGQCDAVLERAVHALAVERHHRVGGIADQHGAPLLVPALQGERAKQARRVLLPVGAQVGDQRQRIGEFAREQRLGLRTGIDRREAGIALVGQEQGDGEGAFVVGQGDAHVVATGPDMQCVALDAEATVGGRRDLQLLVGVVEEGDILAQRRAPVHRRAQRRPCAVGTDQGIEVDVVRAVVAIIDEARMASIEINGVQAAVEVHGGAGPFGQLQQRGVQVTAVDRPDHLAVVAAVALQLRRAVARVHHAAAHHHRAGHHFVFHAGLAQCIAPALGQRQVDRAAALVVGHARITAAFVQGDAPALP